MDQFYNTSVTVSDFVYSVSRAPVQREAAAPLQTDSALQWVPSRHDITGGGLQEWKVSASALREQWVTTEKRWSSGFGSDSSS